MASNDNSTAEMETCKKCGHEFATNRMKNLHERVAHDKLPCHRCPHCLTIYGHAKDLNEHLLGDHKNVEYSFACDKCPEKFSNAVVLKEHETGHKSNNASEKMTETEYGKKADMCVGRAPLGTYVEKK